MEQHLDIAVEDIDLAQWHRIFDVRPHAMSAARLPGSQVVALTDVVSAASEAGAQRILVVCDVGMRSRLAVAALHDAGIPDARSMDGGLEAWRRAGLPLEHAAGLSYADLDRYDRQIKLPGFGVDGQRSLSGASVAIVGAGGLGSPVISYLAGAGVGALTIIDDDSVAVSNLHRQPIYGTADEGTSKAQTAGAYAAGLNPAIDITVVANRLEPESAPAALTGFDLIVDATDNHPTRYLVNDTAVALGTPVVTGAVYRYEGRVLTVSPDGPCYRCAFPVEAADATMTDCSIVGVLGSVVGTIGSMMATSAIQALVTPEGSEAGRMVVFDGRTAETMVVRVRKRSDCPACG